MSTSNATSVEPRRKRALFVAGFALIAAFASRHGYLIGESYCHPTRTHVTEADREKAHAALPTLEDVEFRSSDGVLLRGFYLPPKNGCVVVMGHGLWENRMRFLHDAEMLARHDYGALFFDFRAHGESGGEASTLGDREQLDFRAAVDFAAQKSGPGVKLAALGFSIGSSAVAIESAQDARVGAVILESTWPSLAEEIADKVPHVVERWPAELGMMRSGVRFDHIKPIEIVGAIAPRPLLMLVGSIEHDTTVSTVERVFAAAKEPKKLWVVPNADHGTYLERQPETYERTVIGFLDEAFFGR